TSPVNGATIANQTYVILSWPAAANASSYDVYMWTGATAPAYPIGNVTATSYTVGNLTASTVYNWYIVPVNSAGPAAGCGIANKTSFTTASIIPPLLPASVTVVPSCFINASPFKGAPLLTKIYSI